MEEEGGKREEGEGQVLEGGRPIDAMGSKAARFGQGFHPKIHHGAHAMAMQFIQQCQSPGTKDNGPIILRTTIADSVWMHN
jgi:hypothetical protein